ncbi:hypothetical protein BASA62_010379 [Batrachochytrium salamandrivorans]|nr:hypothetical protein BASA62_010379 [Batrachochytrium salamandrivorans]
MSLIIDWDLLKDGVEAGRLKELVNQHFKEIDRPSFIGDITVSYLDFGDIPPEIEIVDICDPLPEFYFQEDVGYESENGISFDFAGHQQNLHYPSGGGLSTRGAAESIARSVSSGFVNHAGRGGNEDLLQPTFDRVDDLQYVQMPQQETDAQLELKVGYHGNMRLSISTELIINQPTPEFMVLPLALTLTGFFFEGTAVIAYLGYAINFCFKEPPNGENILQDMTIESEIGDKNKQVLKNVGKIERFIVQQLKSFFQRFSSFSKLSFCLLDAGRTRHG